MSATPQWTAYSSDEMRRQYVVREVVPGAPGYLERWRVASAAVRARHGDHLEIAFGPSAEERLDVFRPRTPAPGAPVQVLFHGGYWRALHKDEFALAAAPGLESGVLSVVVNYDLCPAVSLTELVEQCRRAVAWTVDHIAAYGGNPMNMFMSGHSAGAHLSAMMLALDWATEIRDRFRIRGICGVSGVYDLAPLPHTPFQIDLRLTNEEVRTLSPVLLPIRLRCPILLTCGTAETQEFIRQTDEYAAHCRAQGIEPTVQYLDGRNHYSAFDALVEPDHLLCREWLGWMMGAAPVSGEGDAASRAS